MSLALTLVDAFGRLYTRIMADDDKKPNDTSRDFQVEVKIGRTKSR
jgi:hypothetical protein